MLSRGIFSVVAITAMSASLVTYWIAFPTEADLELVPPLRAWMSSDSSRSDGHYASDLVSLTTGFRSQVYRSFCGPASVATVLRAYGVREVNQAAMFPSLGAKLKAFYTGMSLADLAGLAEAAGLRSEVVYADRLSLDTFRERLKGNLSSEGDFVLINYDRRVLKQSGAGHISPVGAYDEAQDAFLVLDEAAYKYPFTWVPTQLLYDAVHTRDGDRFRGVLLIRAYGSSG